jgi:hypothetical protein
MIMFFFKNLAVWMDVYEPEAVVPTTTDGQVVMKVARVRHDPKVQERLNPSLTVSKSASNEPSNVQPPAVVSPPPVVSPPSFVDSAHAHTGATRQLRRPSVVYDGSGNAVGFADDGSAAMPPPMAPTPSFGTGPTAAHAVEDTADLLGGFGEVASPAAAPSKQPPSTTTGEGDLIGLLDTTLGMPSGEATSSSGSLHSLGGSGGNLHSMMEDPFAPMGLGFGQPMVQQQPHQRHQQPSGFNGIDAFGSMQSHQQSHHQSFQG